MSSHTLYTVRNFVRRFLPKHGKKLGQKVASVRWGNSLPIFGSRFHHTMIKQISIVETWWNRVPNVECFTILWCQLLGWAFYHISVKEWIQISNSIYVFIRWQRTEKSKADLSNQLLPILQSQPRSEIILKSLHS